MSTTPERDQKAFVTDFFDTIEEAGLVDIAEAAGIYSAVARPGAGAAAAASSAGPSAAEAAAAAALNGIPGCACPARPPHPCQIGATKLLALSRRFSLVAGRCRRSCPPPALQDPLLCPPRSTVRRARARGPRAVPDPPRSPSPSLSPRRPHFSGWSGDAGEPAAKKKRMQRGHGGKQGDKGLRHFSMKVCEKVEQKARTTYNEVADELVAEFAIEAAEGLTPQDQQYDEKNIRRRVYDALNVLMAMDIITKEKKSIMWRGLPTNTEQEGARLQMDLNNRTERVGKKKLHLQELLMQQIAFKNLISRNKRKRGADAPPAAAPADGAASASASGATDERIPLPFIIVNTRKETVIDCEMAEDKQEIFFNFSAPFEIHDDNEILKRMSMHRCVAADLGDLVPPSLEQYTAQWLELQKSQPAK